MLYIWNYDSRHFRRTFPHLHLMHVYGVFLTEFEPIFHQICSLDSSQSPACFLSSAEHHGGLCVGMFATTSRADSTARQRAC